MLSTEVPQRGLSSFVEHAGHVNCCIRWQGHVMLQQSAIHVACLHCRSLPRPWLLRGSSRFMFSSGLRQGPAGREEERNRHLNLYFCSNPQNETHRNQRLQRQQLKLTDQQTNWEQMAQACLLRNAGSLIKFDILQVLSAVGRTEERESLGAGLGDKEEMRCMLGS